MPIAYIVTYIDTALGSPTKGQRLWASVVDDYRPVFEALGGPWDRVLTASSTSFRNQPPTRR